MTDANRNVPWVPTDDPRIAEREVKEVRAELADTVEELAHRLDVPARLRDKRHVTAQRVQQQVLHARDVVNQRAPGLSRTLQQQLTHARDVVSQRAPALSRTLQQQPALAAAIALVVVSLLTRRLRRRTHRKDEDGTR
jgi:hypothetical protein